jgi:rod shape-determining protein MreC
LVAAGRDLVRYAAALEHSLAKDDLIRAELSRMEALLRLPPRAGFRYEVARVERRDLAAWWQQVVIRKGSNYGIEVGSPVVYAGGAAGRVREVGAYSSVVELISSPELRVAAVIEGDTRPIQYQGVPAGAFSPAAGRIAFVPLDFRLEPGKPARVITSGLGGSFPEGLVIGTVSQLELSPDGLFQQGEVRIDPAIASLQEVSVIMREQGPGN